MMPPVIPTAVSAASFNVFAVIPKLPDPPSALLGPPLTLLIRDTKVIARHTAGNTNQNQRRNYVVAA